VSAATTRPATAHDGADATRSAERPAITMEEAVGYAGLPCDRESPVDDALALKHDRLFLLTDRHGGITPPGNCALGLFEDDTRLLSRYELRAAGGPPVRLSAQVIEPFRGTIALAVTDHAFGGNDWDPKNAIYLRRELMLDEGLLERLTITSYLPRAIDYWIELLFGCDFADIFEVRGWKREARGEFFAPRIDDDGVRFAYRGRDGAVIESDLRFRAPPDSVEHDRARWVFSLAPGEPVQLEWRIGSPSPAAARAVSAKGAAADAARAAAGAFDERRDRLRAEYQAWREDCSCWSSDVEAFDATLARATDDLRSLYVHVDDARVVSAGVPWYSTIFGRDSIITSIETLPLTPRIAIDTLRYLARRQGRVENAYTEEQPGKILHELRRGEMARSGEIPHVPYYGTIDATPLWIILLHETWRWTGDDALVRSLLPNLRRALEWIDRYGDVDGDGLIEYARTSERGLVNQGWKDSGDGVPYPDGRLPEPPIALVEVQGYAYDAKLRAAELFRHLGDDDAASRLRSEADRLRAQVLDRFWIEELGTFALALDGDKHPLPTVTSNAGHLLWSRLPDVARAQRVTSTLLAPDMNCGWGIRTLSARHPVFNPMSYHDGSVWPHDNALIVLGMSHYGVAPRATPIVSAIYEAATSVELSRLPELYCGMTRGDAPRPVLYPVSCSPQAWASGALFLMLQGVLGIMPDVPRRELHIRNPVLPEFLGELTITGLAVGRSRVALHFVRRASRTLVNLLAVESEDEPIKVRIELD
jgi:glycogen debranching enzyme